MIGKIIQEECPQIKSDMKGLVLKYKNNIIICCIFYIQYSKIQE